MSGKAEAASTPPASPQPSTPPDEYIEHPDTGPQLPRVAPPSPAPDAAIRDPDTALAILDMDDVPAGVAGAFMTSLPSVAFGGVGNAPAPFAAFQPAAFPILTAGPRRDAFVRFRMQARGQDQRRAERGVDRVVAGYSRFPENGDSALWAGRDEKRQQAQGRLIGARWSSLQAYINQRPGDTWTRPPSGRLISDWRLFEKAVPLVVVGDGESEEARSVESSATSWQSVTDSEAESVAHRRSAPLTRHQTRVRDVAANIALRHVFKGRKRRATSSESESSSGDVSELSREHHATRKFAVSRPVSAAHYEAQLKRKRAYRGFRIVKKRK